MKKIASILVVTLTLACLTIGIVLVAAQTKAVNPKTATANKDIILANKDAIQIALNPITDVKVKCCGGSMSSARVCVEATLVNKSGTPQTYTTKFIGMKAGTCIQYDKEYCKKHPPAAGMLCIDPCLKTSAPTPETVAGPTVTVPPNGSAPLNILAPNTTYVAGSKLEVRQGNAAPHTTAVPPINQCVL